MIAELICFELMGLWIAVQAAAMVAWREPEDELEDELDW